MTGPKTFLDGRVRLFGGDCRDAIALLPDCSVHSVVCDPPYALESIRKRFGAAGAAPAQFGTDGAFARASRGFMGRAWDTGEVAFDPAFWAEVLRVLRPGGHLVAFSGTRTYHRMACAIDDAGFEVRDQLAWMYGNGFPKSHNIGKALGDDAGPWAGWGTALKPAWEPICLARKPLDGTVAANVLAHGCGGLNVDGCRIGDEVRHASYTSLAACAGNRLGAAETRGASRGTQGDLVRYEGRFPANVLHDGSDEVVSAFPEAPGQLRSVGPGNGEKRSVNVFGDYGPRDECAPRGDSGSAARFFYSAKAGADDRFDFTHPTVKPVDLMRWLVRLVTQRGGVVLDPFAGTGPTGAAAFWEGCDAILCEREPEYQGFIAKRLEHVLSGPDARKRARTEAQPHDDGSLPLFAPSGIPEHA